MAIFDIGSLGAVLLFITTFWRIATLRSGPQVLPDSRFLLGLVLSLHLLAGIALASLFDRGGHPLLAALLGTGFTALAVAAVLSLSGYGHRIKQTLSAMAGCDVLLAFFALPVQFWLNATTGSARLLPGLFAIIVVAWNIAVVAHIMRHALDMPFAFGVVFAIVYLGMAASLDGMLVAGG